jgi:hypothetical protein
VPTAVVTLNACKRAVPKSPTQSNIKILNDKSYSTKNSHYLLPKYSPVLYPDE